MDSEKLNQLHSTFIETLGFAATAGQKVMGAALLINGGAAVALLALFGNAPVKDTSFPKIRLSLSLLAFSLGVLAAGFAAMATYFSHFKNAEVMLIRMRSVDATNEEAKSEIEKLRCGVTCYNWIASRCCFCSLFLFFGGVLCAFWTFLSW